jgi:hypothetical protein
VSVDVKVAVGVLLFVDSKVISMMTQLAKREKLKRKESKKI